MPNSLLQNLAYIWKQRWPYFPPVGFTWGQPAERQPVLQKVLNISRLLLGLKLLLIPSPKRGFRAVNHVRMGSETHQQLNPKSSVSPLEGELGLFKKWICYGKSTFETYRPAIRQIILLLEQQGRIVLRTNGSCLHCLLHPPLILFMSVDNNNNNNIYSWVRKIDVSNQTRHWTACLFLSFPPPPKTKQDKTKNNNNKIRKIEVY